MWTGRIVAIARVCKTRLPRIPSQVRVLPRPPLPLVKRLAYIIAFVLGWMTERYLWH